MRNGTGTYVPPVGWEGIPDHTIESAKYNGLINDIVNDLNTARPLLYGGTGASNGVDARHNIGAEVSGQTVTNYNSHIWENGSFHSFIDVPTAPVPGHSFAGISYAFDINYIVVEARDLSDGKLYVRRKTAGVWGAWVWDQQGVSDAKVSKAGDVMTGNLVLQYGDPQIILDSNPAGNPPRINGEKGGSLRWVVNLANNVAESGSNAGSNFTILRCNDSGFVIDTALEIERATGRVLGNGGAPVGVNDFVNKAYADLKVSRSGDTMTGNLTVSGNLTAGAVNTNGGTLYVTASGAGNASVLYRNNAAADKGYVLYDMASNALKMLHLGSGHELSIENSGSCKLGRGVLGRAGMTGAQDVFTHNYFWTGSAMQVWVESVNMGNMSITCDYRIKKDVRPLRGMWRRVKRLRPIGYTQKEFTPAGATAPLFVGDDILRWGFLAHELQDVLLPTAASGVKDAPNEIQSPNLMAIVAALTKALQEAMERIEVLEVQAGLTPAAAMEEEP